MEIRGVWITTTNSQVLDDPKNIAEAMKFLADTGFNVVFPVVWNNGSTNYRSQVMLEKFGIEIKERREFKDRDPLAELIAEAQKVDIAVIPWFEYGFMSSYQGKNGGIIIEKKPEWAARDYNGKNLHLNGFYWLNPLDNEVQDFLLSLFLEVAKKYAVAGVQGDDHFIALPMEGGYNDNNIQRYEKEFNQKPPQPPTRGYSQDPLWQDKLWIQQWKQWVRWRADILSNFLNRLYRAIINVNPELVISMSPSIYPWGYENYLQDSQTWVDLGLVDLIHPQLYRREFAAYNSTIDTLKKEQFTQQQLPLLTPGLLLQKTLTSNPTQGENEKEHFIVSAIKYNREAGIPGEVLFFYEDLRKDDDALAKLLKATVYSQSPGKFDPKAIKNNTFTHRRINNYIYLNDSSPERISQLKYDWIEPFSEGIAAVKMGYKWGYIDKTAKLVGRLEYDTVTPFTEGLALVKINNYKNPYIGYIDKTAKRITKLKLDDGLSFSEGVAAVKIANQWGYIDQVGTIIINPQFEEAKSFVSDLAAVKISGKWGYINKSGGTVIFPEFDEARNFSEGLALVKTGKKFGYIDITGQVVIEPQFDDGDMFSEGLAPVKISGKWGYINEYGELLIPANFNCAKPFSGGLGLVNVGGEIKVDNQTGQTHFLGGKWGYIRKP
ncbi:hypothetical protein B6N60_01227 [Richelia sinica FACHB-800]|uniref:Glycosyl hydrolase-like 10 domain-containing protein n=1 Tax=Richelia sinica FACHB-800 TaxID=1357546 RepID=A0A975Y3V8_9NOST|nr:WG repeat-containing protein [Richelia sinica]MBD2664232.1 WG repeat-containing protein [Richelia sinica FACHB-800]QXE22544.1 hypothetical protein B6N60_01227 [Richelia sinica FACHB-800]